MQYFLNSIWMVGKLLNECTSGYPYIWMFDEWNDSVNDDNIA